MNPLPAIPRFAPIDRSQFVLRTVDVERLIDVDHSARSICEVVGRMDLNLYLGEIAAVEGRAGRDHTAPRLLISLWLYAYSRGIEFSGLTGLTLLQMRKARLSHSPGKGQFRQVTKFETVEHAGWSRSVSALHCSRQRRTKIHQAEICLLTVEDRYPPRQPSGAPRIRLIRSNSRRVRTAAYSSRIAVTGFRRIARCAGK